MLKSFKGKTALAVNAGDASKGFPSHLIGVARRKLFMLDNAHELKDLASPPRNKLHALRGDREGQHAIRINDQYRIFFRWVDGHAEDVEITDYH